MDEIKGIARVKIHPGKLDEWKRLTEQAMEIVRARDPGTLQYEVFFNDDESEAIVFERYRDADAALEHFANIGHLMEPLMTTATVTGEVLGTPNEAMRAQLGDGEPKLFTPWMAAHDSTTARRTPTPGLQMEESTMNSMARRMFELVEPIGVIPYSADEPNEAMFALGFTNYWDTYFAGRAAPLGLVPAEVVDALFYNFAPGEVARHIPKVWRTTTPEAAIAARQIGCVKALRRILGDQVDSRAFTRAADLLLEAATSAPFEGRPMYAALRAIPIPDDVVARLFHAASLLREHRGDGHIAALMIEGVGGLEAHVLLALDMGMPAAKFGRIHHLPAAQLAAVIHGMSDRGLIGNDGCLSATGRAVKQRVEALTDDLAAPPYESLEPGELDELMAALEPLATRLLAAQDG